LIIQLFYDKVSTARDYLESNEVIGCLWMIH